MGGGRVNMSKAKRKTLTGRGAVGKEAVVGAKDRKTNRVAVRHIQHTDAPHVAGFVVEKTKPGATVYTDEAAAYNPLGAWFDHESVDHGTGEYVRDQAHINGIESFWSMLKRAPQGRLSQTCLQSTCNGTSKSSQAVTTSARVIRLTRWVRWSPG